MTVNSVRRVAMALGVISCVCVFASSWSYLQRHSSVGELQSSLQRWQAKGFVDELGEHRERATHIAESVVTHGTDNPELSEQVTRVLEWLAWESRLSRKRSLTFRAQAVANAKATLALRPTDSTAWSTYLNNVMLAEGFSQAARVALTRAISLGGWELQSQRTIATFGINYWDLLDESSRSIVLEVVRRGVISDMTHHPQRLDQELIELAYQRRWHENIRPLLVNDYQRAYLRQLADR